MNCLAFRRMLAWYAAGGVAAVAVPVSATGTEEKFYSVKLHVNIYNGAGTTIEEVKDAVKRANEILKPAMVRLELMDACISENVEVPGGNDGGLSADERDTARRDGRVEVAGEDGKGKGVKASFIMNPKQKEPGVNGLAVEGDPTIILRENAAGNEKTAQTMAHEFGHVFGLRDLYDAGTADRLMHGYGTRTDVMLAEDEIATIKGNAKGFGNEITKKTGGAPAARTPEEHGAKANSDAPVPGGSEKTISFARISRHAGDPHYLIMFEVGGVFPPTLSPSQQFRALFDTDSNPGTGATLFGIPGIDSQVIVGVFGAGTYAANFQGFNPPATASLPVRDFRGLECFNDEMLAPPDQPTFTPEHDFLFVEVPAHLLQFTAGDLYFVPVLSRNTTDGVTDRFDILFDRTFSSRGPQIMTDAGEYAPGDHATVSLSGFRPVTIADLFLDDRPIGEVSIDEVGSFMGPVALPMDLPSTYYFLVARERLQRAAGPPPALDGFAATVITIAAPPFCAGDADDNGIVNFADVTNVLANFGADYSLGSGPGDADGNGIVNFADVTNVLANFGAVCP